MDKVKSRRRQPRQGVAKNYYLPIPLTEEIKELADLKYGGNQSDLVTRLLIAGLSKERPKEAHLQTA